MHPRFLNLVAIICIIGLILGIAGVSSANDSESTYHANTIVKASMAIFLAVFVIVLLVSIWLLLQLRHSLRVFQKKLFLAIALSCPFVSIRLIYSAIADYTDSSRFAVLSGDPTVYLCMNVLEEIIAMALIMILGMSAVLEKDFIKPIFARVSSDQQMGEGV
jgi:hypothetical protein